MSEIKFDVGKTPVESTIYIDGKPVENCLKAELIIDPQHLTTVVLHICPSKVEVSPIIAEHFRSEVIRQTEEQKVKNRKEDWRYENERD